MKHLALFYFPAQCFYNQSRSGRGGAGDHQWMLRSLFHQSSDERQGGQKLAHGNRMDPDRIHR